MRRLEIRDKTALAVRELSALTIRSGAEGQPQLLAVGDQDFAMVSAEFGAGGRPEHISEYDLRPALRDTQVNVWAKSGFEGVAADGDGTIVLLQEEQARLLVLASDLSRLLKELVLAVPFGDPVLDPAWHRRPNERGEGLLLLGHGHVLIAKQRDEPCLIEFGPPGDSPIGVAGDTLLAPNDVFQRETTDSELVPLAVWRLARNTATMLPAINDLARGPDGRVYALSAPTQVIARLEKRLEPGERAHATDAWQLDEQIAGGHEARLEGLAILPSGRPIVGIDTTRHDNNVVMFQRLDSR